jgi:hypothetical protein
MEVNIEEEVESIAPVDIGSKPEVSQKLVI